MMRSSRRAAGEPPAGQGLRTGRALLAVAGLAAALAACSAGQDAQTAFVSPSIDGANGQVGDVALRDITIAFPEGGQYAAGSDARLQVTLVNTAAQDDALVEVQTDVAQRVTLGTGPAASGSATPSAAGSSSPPLASVTASASGSATVSATASATGSGSPGATGTVSASAPSTASPTPTAQPPTRIPLLAGNLVACRDKGPVLTLVGLTRALRSAEVVPITFVFATAGQVSIQVPVAVPLTEVSPAPTVDVNATETGG